MKKGSALALPLLSATFWTGGPQVATPQLRSSGDQESSFEMA